MNMFYTLSLGIIAIIVIFLAVQSALLKKEKEDAVREYEEIRRKYSLLNKQKQEKIKYEEELQQASGNTADSFNAGINMLHNLAESGRKRNKS